MSIFNITAKRALLLMGLATAASNASAQFELHGQLLERAELRNGYGLMIAQKTDPAVFISQRLRLQAKYTGINKLTFYTNIQDVRTWGNTPQVKLTDGLLSVHEAWAEVHVDSSLSFKLGRQELNYDNARFLGNLDWAMQARSHDFALVKYEKPKFKIHVGGGFSQDGEALKGNIFTTANQYKTAQMLRAEYKTGGFEIAFLFWNNGRQYTVKDSVGQVIEKGVRFTQTISLPTIKYQLKNTTFSAFYYHQLGKDVTGKMVNAYDANLQVSQLFTFNEEKKNQLRLTLGAELLSGTAGNNTTNNNYSFSPMYGTNHAHNGYMDLFYVGGRYEGSRGLNDFFLRMKYEFNPSFFIALDGHWFMANAKVFDGAGNAISQQLGAETDLTMGYVLKNKAVSFQAGYSHLFALSSLKVLQGQTTPKPVQQWAYLMMIVRPKMDKKFIGLLQ